MHSNINNIIGTLNFMKILQKNEVWMLIFSIGMLYWLFNPSVPMTLIMIVPLLIATTSKK
tara:strand:- start:142 stop:321 length:180 start_codon:yes stop_codon:yes gene_type:complete